MKLNSLHLKNYRCFANLQVELHPQLTVFVAENGEGKSTLLDAIRIALWPFVSSFDLAHNTFNDPGNAVAIDDVRLIRLPNGDMARQLPCSVTTTGNYGDGGERTWVRYRDKEAKLTKTKDDGDMARLKKWAAGLQTSVRSDGQPHVNLPVFGYYGTGRLWAQKRLTETSRTRGETPKTDFYIRTFAYLNCLDPASSFKHFKEWYVWAFESYRESQIKLIEGKADDQQVRQLKAPVLVIQQAIDAFLKPITGWHSLEYSVSNQKSLTLQHDEFGTLKVDMLSDGIRSILATVGDIAYRCVKLNPHLGDRAALESKGVVLIDEVDMHLHPSWQQLILQQLAQTFPLIQFIVTTHSPQVLSTVTRENIRIIRRHAGGYEAAMPDFSPLAHEAGDALSQVMGTHTRPDLPVLGKVREFEQLVRSGQEQSVPAVNLLQEIQAAGYQIPESDLTTWRFLASRKSNGVNHRG